MPHSAYEKVEMKGECSKLIFTGIFCLMSLKKFINTSIPFKFSVF